MDVNMYMWRESLFLIVLSVIEFLEDISLLRKEFNLLFITSSDEVSHPLFQYI